MTSFHVRVPQRWIDLDAQGHVNNAAVVDYLQEARVAFLLDGPHGHLLGNGIVVVGHQVEYLASGSFSHEPLDVRLDVGEVGASRFTLGYEVGQGAVHLARARTTLCHFDFERGRPTRLQPDERAWLSEHAAPLEPLRELGQWRVGVQAHEYPVTVRWSDLDSYGHVNNTTFYDYVAEARIALNADLLPNSIRASMHDEVEHAWMIARQDMTYVAQLNHRRLPYLVRTALGPTGRTSVTLAAEISDPASGEVFARSLTVLVHADGSGRPSPLPQEMREAARRWPAVGREGAA